MRLHEILQGFTNLGGVGDVGLVERTPSPGFLNGCSCFYCSRLMLVIMNAYRPFLVPKCSRNGSTDDSGSPKYHHV
jgi:hypothetical protein